MDCEYVPKTLKRQALYLVTNVAEIAAFILNILFIFVYGAEY